MKLDGYFGSRSQHAVWALEEAGVGYEYVRVDLVKAEGTQDINRFVLPHMPVIEPTACHRPFKCAGSRSCHKRWELRVMLHSRRFF